MDQKKVFFCYKCNELYYSSNAAVLKCPKCKGTLTDMNISTDKWESMSDEEHDELLRQYMPNANRKPVASAQTSGSYTIPTGSSSKEQTASIDSGKDDNVKTQESSSWANWIRNLSLAYMVISVIGCFLLMSDSIGVVSVPAGLALILVNLMFGMLVYGVGEICDTLNQINSKLK